MTGKESDARTMKPLSFWQSAAFQYANPKAWMLAAATAGSFMTNHPTFVSIAIIVIVFSTAAIGSLITWTWVGSALRHWLSVGSRMRTFNLVMGFWLLPHCGLWCCEVIRHHVRGDTAATACGGSADSGT